MPPFLRRLGRVPAIALLLPVILLVSACTATTSVPVVPITNPPPTAPAANVRSNTAGMVTVDATWNGPAAGAMFDIKIETHSVDLDALDLSNGVLRNDRGDTLTAQPWMAAMGGHHREGSLSFSGAVAPFMADAKWIELTLPDIADVPARTFRWDVAP